MNNQTDERIVATRQRWAARGFWILYLALSIDLIVRTLVLKQTPSQYLDIALIWMATMVYVSFGMVRSGVNLYPKKWSNVMLVALIALQVPVVLWLTGQVNSWLQYLVYVVITAASASVTMLVFQRIFRRWERKTLGQDSLE